jgi:tetratricopeptide (TPR) repeat protein
MEALPFEGASEIHSLFARTHVQLGLARMRERDWPAAVRELERSKEYPEKLGSGRPFDPDLRLQDYLLGLAYGRLGEADRAEAAFQAVVGFTLKFPESRGTGAYFGSLALRRAGQAQKAAEVDKRASPPPKEILEIIK